MRQELRRDAATGIADHEVDLSALAVDGDRDLALAVAERDRIGQDVVDHLAKPHGITLELRGLVESLRCQCDAVLGGLRGERGHGLATHLREIDGPQIDEQLAADRARDIEQIADQARLRESARADRRERLRANVGTDRVVVQDLLPQEQRRHRRAELVRDGGEELILQTIRLLRIGTRGLGLREQLGPFVLCGVLVVCVGRGAEPALAGIVGGEAHAMPAEAAARSSDPHLDLRRPLPASFPERIQATRKIVRMNRLLPAILCGRAREGEPARVEPRPTSGELIAPQQRIGAHVVLACEHGIRGHRAHDDHADRRAVHSAERAQRRRAVRRSAACFEWELRQVQGHGGPHHVVDRGQGLHRDRGPIEQLPPRCVGVRRDARGAEEHGRCQLGGIPQRERFGLASAALGAGGRYSAVIDERMGEIRGSPEPLLEGLDHATSPP